MRTNLPNVFAIGDCVGGKLLAHKAEEEGVDRGRSHRRQAGAHALPLDSRRRVHLAGDRDGRSRGARGEGVGTAVPRRASSPSRRTGAPARPATRSGFVKVIADATTDELLGVHMIGPNVSELIAEVVLGVRVSCVVRGHRHHGARAPDALRGDQGSCARRPRSRDPHLVAVAAIVVRPLMPADAESARAARRRRLSRLAVSRSRDRSARERAAVRGSGVPLPARRTGGGSDRRTGSCSSAPSSARDWPRRCTPSCLRDPRVQLALVDAVRETCRALRRATRRLRAAERSAVRRRRRSRSWRADSARRDAWTTSCATASRCGCSSGGPAESETVMNRRRFLALGASAVGAAAASGVYAWQIEPYWLELVRRPMPLAESAGGARREDAAPGERHPRRTARELGLSHPIARRGAGARARLRRLHRRLRLLSLGARGDGARPRAAQHAARSARHRGVTRQSRLRAQLAQHRRRRRRVARRDGRRHGRAAERRAHDRRIAVRRSRRLLEPGVRRRARRAARGRVARPAFEPVRASRDATRPRRCDCSRPDSRPSCCRTIPDVQDLPIWDGVRGWVLAGHTHGGQVKRTLPAAADPAGEEPAIHGRCVRGRARTHALHQSRPRIPHSGPLRRASRAHAVHARARTVGRMTKRSAHTLRARCVAHAESFDQIAFRILLSCFTRTS